jgi:hypothetical protein
MSESPEEKIQPVESSSSKQASNFSELCLIAIAKELGRLTSGRLNIQTITFVIKLDRKGKPRTVLTRTESRSELSA